MAHNQESASMKSRRAKLPEHSTLLHPAKLARRKCKMSQEDFAEAFGVSLATVRNWEQGRRQPEGPARVLLNVISREPKAVLRALHAAA
jgi:putative transcriptional regulator